MKGENIAYIRYMILNTVLLISGIASNEKNFTLCWQSVTPIQMKKLVKKNVIWINMYLYKFYCNALKIRLFVIYMLLWIHMHYMNQSLHSQHSRARLNAWANYKIFQMPHADTVGIGLSRLQNFHLP